MSEFFGLIGFLILVAGIVSFVKNRKTGISSKKARNVIILGATLFLLGLSIPNSEGHEATHKSTPVKQSTAKESGTHKNQSTKQNDSRPSEPKEKIFKIGDLVTVGKVDYTINSKQVADEVGPEFLKEKPKEKFLILDVTVKNNSDKPISISNNFFKLFKENSEFKSDSSASIAANQEKDPNNGTDFFYKDLNPESTINGKVVFDVSENIINDAATQIQVQTGAWGTQTGRINLN